MILGIYIIGVSYSGMPWLENMAHLKVGTCEIQPHAIPNRFMEWGIAWGCFEGN